MIYFPTTLVLLDDDATFLSVLAESLQEEDFCIQSFTSPAKALDFIQNSYEKAEKLRLFPPKKEEDWGDWIREIRDCSETATIPSCVISDFKMPQKDGLDFFESIKKPVSKILLTGILDQTSAIKAFNTHKINKFYPKDSLNQIHDLKNAIRDEIDRFFIRNYALTESIEVAEQLLHLCKKLDITHLYPLDFSGAYHVQFRAGGSKTLFCPTHNQLSEQITFLQKAGVDRSLLDLLHQGKSYIPLLADDLLDLKFSQTGVISKKIHPLIPLDGLPLLAGYILL